MSFGGIPGFGAARVTKLALHLDDNGALAKLGMLQSRMNLMGASFGGAAQKAGLLRVQLGILGFAAVGITAKLTQSFVQFEQKALGAFMTAKAGQKGLLSDMRRDQGLMRSELKKTQQEIFRTARALNMDPNKTADLQRQVAQLGLDSPKDELARQRLTMAGGKLSKVTFGEISGAAATESIFRVLNITSDGDDEKRRKLLLDSERYASALVRVGDASAAGIVDVTEFLRKMQQIGVVANFDAEELIALSGAIADVDQGIREASSSAVGRLFTRVIPNNSDAIFRVGQIVSNDLPEDVRSIFQDRAEFEKARTDSPMELLRGVAAVFRSVSQSGISDEADETSIEELVGRGLLNAEMGALFEQMGFVNVRDIKTLSAIGANDQKLVSMIKKAREELEIDEKQMEINQRYDLLLKSLGERFKKLGLEMKIFAIKAGEALSPIIGPAVDLFSRFFEAVNQSEMAIKALALTLTVFPFAIFIAGMAKLWQVMKPFAAIGNALRGGQILPPGMGGNMIGGVPVHMIPGDLKRSIAMQGVMEERIVAQMVTKTGRISKKGAPKIALDQLNELSTTNSARLKEIADKAAQESVDVAKNFRTNLRRNPLGTIGRLILGMEQPMVSGAKMGLGQRLFGGLAARSAGFMGRMGGTLFARGGVGLMARVGAGVGLAGGAAGLGLGVLTGPVGTVLAIISALTPVFRGLGTALEKIGNSKGGPLGVFIKQLAFLMKVLEAVGNVTNWLFEKIWEGVKWAFGKIVGAFKWLTEETPLKHFFDAKNAFWAGLNDKLDEFNDLEAFNESADKIAEAGNAIAESKETSEGDDKPDVTTHTTVHLPAAQSGQFNIQKTLEEAAKYNGYAVSQALIRYSRG